VDITGAGCSYGVSNTFIGTTATGTCHPHVAVVFPLHKGRLLLLALGK
jgi:hypothetical protein